MEHVLVAHSLHAFKQILARDEGLEQSFDSLNGLAREEEQPSAGKPIPACRAIPIETASQGKRILSSPV